MLCLVIESDGRRVSHPFRDGALRVGSADDNDAVVDSPYVSRHHLALLSLDGSVEVRDLGSRNGTLVDGRRITSGRFTPPFEIHLGTSLTATVTSVPSEELALGVVNPLPPPAPAPRTPALPTDPARSAGAGERDQELGSAVIAALASGDPLAAPHRLVSAVATRGRQATLVHVDSRGGITAVHHSGAGSPLELEAGDVERTMREDSGRLEPRGEGVVSFAAASTPRGRVVLVVTGDCTRADLATLHHALRLAWRLHEPSPSTDSPAPPAPRTFTLEVLPGHVDGTSEVVRALHARISPALGSSLPVLLVGSTGVGKELYARAIHAQSSRSAGPLRAVNSSAFPEHLQEALLFGVESGVATGVARQPGLLREADGGTFLFDEIGEMSLLLQAKLLRVLDHGEVLPVGGTKPVKVSLRVMAATNRDLEAEVAAGRFRADLLYRLGGHVFRIPDLAEHAEDIPVYVSAFLRSECAASGRHVTGVTVKGMRLLLEHAWPGNVRELEHLVRRLVHETKHGEAISHQHLPAWLVERAPAKAESLEDQLDPHRRRLILAALDATGWSRQACAKRLGMSRTRLRLLMGRLGIDEPRG